MAPPHKENSYGIIPLTYRENYWEVFIICHLNGGHWGFPKGHAEQGESPKETAERELFEETKQRVLRYLPHPYLTESYQFKKGETLIDKTVRFYLAETTTPFFIQSEEITEGKWIPLQALPLYATFPEEKALYEKLLSLLNKKF
ncbi:MAG: NUDIX domain-containing protein [Chlamydiia bacterium]|nr:NUDIX domain-containing protein [Chlamydiia bacterium]